MFNAKVNYYKVLGVHSSSSQDEIKSAFRKLATRYHPDKKPGDKVAEEKFKEVNNAYEVLSDSAMRAMYDLFLRIVLGVNNIDDCYTAIVKATEANRWHWYRQTYDPEHEAVHIRFCSIEHDKWRGPHFADTAGFARLRKVLEEHGAVNITDGDYLKSDLGFCFTVTKNSDPRLLQIVEKAVNEHLSRSMDNAFHKRKHSYYIQEAGIMSGVYSPDIIKADREFMALLRSDMKKANWKVITTGRRTVFLTIDLAQQVEPNRLMDGPRSKTNEPKRWENYFGAILKLNDIEFVMTEDKGFIVINSRKAHQALARLDMVPPEVAEKFQTAHDVSKYRQNAPVAAAR